MHVLGTQNNISVLLSFNLREDWFLRMKNTHFRLGFTRFLVISGPWTHHYFSRQAREVILMGPRTGNDQKTGKTRRKWVFFILRNQSALKLKKVVHITVYFIHTKKGLFKIQVFPFFVELLRHSSNIQSRIFHNHCTTNNLSFTSLTLYLPKQTILG